MKAAYIPYAKILLAESPVGLFLSIDQREALSWCFEWEETPQGREYWYALWRGRQVWSQQDSDYLQSLLDGSGNVEEDLWL
jgi:hypothetical protein